MKQDHKTENIFDTQGLGSQAQGVSRFSFRKARPPFRGLYRAGSANQDTHRNCPITTFKNRRFSILDQPVARHQESTDSPLYSGAPQPQISDHQTAPRP